jgi:AcrR family transcriptional regulator
MTESAPGSRADAHSSTEDRIIEATLTLIAHDGLGAMTMVGIAETAGVSRQTLYNRYPDIDSIVAEAIRRHNRESIQMLESSLRVVDKPGDKLEQLARHVVSIGAHAHHAPGIENGLSAEARATLSEYDNALHRCIREILEEGQRAGVFRRDLTPDADAALIRHMLSGLAELSAETPDKAATLATTGTRTILAAVAKD